METPKLTQEIKKDPKRVIGFLVEYNYGTKDEDAEVIINRLLEQFKRNESDFKSPTAGPYQYLIKNSGPHILNLLGDELEAAGYERINFEKAFRDVLKSLEGNRKPLAESGNPEHAKWQ
jgi:hypothetical protein